MSEDGSFLHRITMKSKKNKKDKDKSKHKGHNGPQGDDHHSGSQSMQHEAASQKEMLMKLKSLPEDEFNSKFEKMLDEMNLKNENLRIPLRKTDHDKKVDMLFQFLKRQSSLLQSSGLVTPDDYISELSKLDLSEDLLQCLQSLRVSLTGGLLSWIKDFGERGLNCLLDILRRYVIGVSPLEQKIQHECAKCLKAFMNNGFGLNMMLKNVQGLTLLAQCIRIENPGMMQDVVKVMAAVGLVAHDKALEALTLKAEVENKPRFVAVVETLKGKQATPPLLVACLQLINALVSTPDELDFRLHLRNEFMRIGLVDALPVLRDFDQDDLNVQLEIFDDQKEEDAIEFQHRFNDIAIHFDDPDEVYKLVKTVNKDTPSESFFLSVLQHLLLIRDDVYARLDPRELDILLGEVVLLSARTELYLGFLRRRLKTDLESVPDDERVEDIATLEDRLISNSGLCRKLQTLIGDYLFMEEYFMREMVFKAVSMDLTEADSLISSMVDDIFYVLQKSLMRTISASNMDAICAMVNNSSSILVSDYKEVLRARIKSGYPSSSLDISGMLQGKLQSTSQSQDTSKLKKNFLVALNNVEVSIENLQKLSSTIKHECDKLFKQIGTDKGKDKVESCLADMASCTQSLKDLLQMGIAQLCANGVLPKLFSLIDGFSSINHIISEDDFALYEVNDPFTQNFIANLEKALSSLKESLTHSNHENVVSMVCSEIAARFEKAVMKCSYNRLGGLQFDKELRALVGYLTNTTEWTVRDKFARLTQIATILNLEKVAELLDYWGPNSGPMTWRLTPAEVRQVLILRVDFRTEDIQRLRL